MQKTLTFLAPFALAVGLALPVASQDAPGADTVVATVNETEITLGHMIAARARLPEQYQQLPDEVLFSGILDQLIQQAAISDTFEGDLPARVTKSIENEQRSLIAGEALELIMAAPVSDDEIKKAYEAKYSDFEAAQEFNASHILVETEEEANALKEQLDGGADFAALAREHSTGPSGPGGGSLGWFGKGMMVPTFEEAVVAMETGQVSAPVKTQFGWHVIKLNDVRDTNAPEMDTVRDELEMDARQARATAAIDEITAAASVDRTASESMDPAILKNLELLE
ncbi:peptidylprolyl isomerase [Sulfitobacter aestuariivivens]|uniref:Parvulin-like PPIase n=1 Tax=Sulfitobacter aestuariivivens TaxID=2766981 RepID=A0A927D7M7_9RHOB|nr:peptidylprolyl isomerase [Sulfitobacter aestuariivivens]MBD3665279.1 peptidylprolyl isomerase [Sulfitobacter aestuariivivens]